MSEDKPDKYDWTDKAPEIAGTFVQVAGVLAGFSITAVILIAGFHQEPTEVSQSILGQVGMGMFMIAFFGHISSAVLFTIVSERDGAHRCFLFVAACCLFWMTGLFTFTALLPLLHIFEVSHLRIAMFFLLSSAVFGGYIGIAFPAKDLLGLDLKHCFVPLLIAILASMPLILVAALLALHGRLLVLLQGILIFPLMVGAAIYVGSMVTCLCTWLPRDSRFGWLTMATMGITTTAVIFSMVATALLVLASYTSVGLA